MSKQLPREIAVRLADTRRHYEALSLVLERTTAVEFVEASTGEDADELNARVYPLERAFEILCNYVAELNELALEEAGIASVDRPTNLRLLQREQVLGPSRVRRWRGILSARNELQHQYPDVRAAGVYDAAAELADDLPAYVRNYVAWMRRLGFGGG